MSGLIFEVLASKIKFVHHIGGVLMFCGVQIHCWFVKEVKWEKLTGAYALQVE